MATYQNWRPKRRTIRQGTRRYGNAPSEAMSEARYAPSSYSGNAGSSRPYSGLRSSSPLSDPVIMERDQYGNPYLPKLTYDTGGSPADDTLIRQILLQREKDLAAKEMAAQQYFQQRALTAEQWRAQIAEKQRQEELLSREQLRKENEAATEKYKATQDPVYQAQQKLAIAQAQAALQNETLRKQAFEGPGAGRALDVLRKLHQGENVDDSSGAAWAMSLLGPKAFDSALQKAPTPLDYEKLQEMRQLKQAQMSIANAKVAIGERANELKAQGIDGKAAIEQAKMEFMQTKEGRQAANATMYINMAQQRIDMAQTKEDRQAKQAERKATLEERQFDAARTKETEDRRVKVQEDINRELSGTAKGRGIREQLQGVPAQEKLNRDLEVYRRYQQQYPELINKMFEPQGGLEEAFKAKLNALPVTPGKRAEGDIGEGYENPFKTVALNQSQNPYLEPRPTEAPNMPGWTPISDTALAQGPSPTDENQWKPLASLMNPQGQNDWSLPVDTQPEIDQSEAAKRREELLTQLQNFLIPDYGSTDNYYG